MNSGRGLFMDPFKKQWVELENSEIVGGEV